MLKKLALLAPGRLIQALAMVEQFKKKNLAATSKKNVSNIYRNRVYAKLKIYMCNIKKYTKS